ncbi:MucBP domain-containing protein [Levilactobacillus humaensis]|uniref:MucBP domain-containing protein n=1 Tax=Levilactobacillus humaensis TaxID=2950375 RepID=UPI0021C2AD17|nr:MucBP domain-containing protein [Levilactobacillus humaensis]
MFHSEDQNVHYKMYKKGKTWIFAGIVTTALALGVAAPQAAHADTTDDETVATTQGSEKTTTGEVTLTTPKAEAEEVTVQDTTQDASEEKVQGATQDAEKQAEQSDERKQNDQAEPAEIDKTDKNVTANNDEQKDKIDDKQTTVVSTQSTDTEEQVDQQVKRLARSVQAPVATPKIAVKDLETIDQWMPNQKLQQVVLLQLRKQNPGKTWNSVADITKDDMALLTSLVAYGSNESGGIDTYNNRKPFSIEGLQYAVNLTRIEMGTNFNYASQKYYGDIVDISPLADLTKLQTVYLQQNRIEDISPLKNLTNITKLQLQFNAISDFTPIAGRKYSTFSATNQVVFLPPIKVNSKTRKAHLVFQFKNENGEIVPLEARNGIAYPDRVVGSGNSISLVYKLYWNGGTAAVDGEGGLYFTGLKDQIPGITEYPGFNIDPLDENFYLTGAVTTQFPGGYSVDIGVIQPYVIGDMGGTVTAHYQDKNGKELAPDVVLDDGFIGDDYTTTAAEVEGYTLTKTPDNATGKYVEGPTDVYYIYEPKTDPVDPPVVNPAADMTVTVHYQTADGKTVAPDQIFTGKQGTTYTTSPVTVEGYALVETPGNASGTLGDGDITVTYIYAPLDTDGDGDLVDPEDPDTDTDEDGDDGDVATPDTDDGGSGDQIVTGKEPIKGGTTNLASRPATNSAKTTLPQTGEQHRSTGLWGIVVLLGSLLGLAGTRRKEQ